MTTNEHQGEGTDARGGRTRNPVYHVFQKQTVRAGDADGEIGAWILIATSVRASNDKAAIQKAVGDAGLNLEDGPWWAPLSTSYRPRNPKTRSEVVW